MQSEEVQPDTSINGFMAAIDKLDRDLKQAARTLGRRQIRFLVDTYYQVQHFRIASSAQARTNAEGAEPNRLLVWNQDQMTSLEKNIQRALQEFSDTYTVGKWMMSICGIGPVISAGLLAHLEIEPWKCVKGKKPGSFCNRANPHGPECHAVSMATGCHFWRFAGLDPTVKWEKGQKRPWNAELKCLVAFKAGECFVKVQSRESDVYGKLYRERKDLEIARNLEGKFKATAEAVLESKRIGKDTEAYKHYSQGMLPPAHLHSRARRWAVKMFLSHVHAAMFEDFYGKPAPRPYIFDHPELGDHRHYIPVPNWPFEEKGKSLKDMGD
jgi:hypothetical protein